MLTQVKLYGHLGRRFGREFTFDIETVREALQALSANLPEFRRYLVEHSEPGYRVVVGDAPVMDVAELGLALTVPRTIKIVPVVGGAASGKGIGQILFGVVLVAAAFFTYGQSLWGFSAQAVSSAALSVGVMGVGMIASGITALVTPVPGMGEEARRSNNTGFGNGQDTLAQGLRVPIGYGRMLCEGLPVSVRLVVENGSP
jgi:predicted phage tail protein